MIDCNNFSTDDRDIIEHLIYFLEDKGYLIRISNKKNLDDLIDEFENLED